MARNRGPVVPTKKHLARMERENIQRRYLMIAMIIVLVSVAGLLIYGLLQQSVFLPRQVVATVNGENILLGDWQARVRFERNSLVNSYIQTYQNKQLFVEQSPEFASSFDNALRQIEIELLPDTVAKAVLDTMIDDIIIRQEAEKLGITVTDEEIKARLEQEFGYLPGGPLATPTSFPTALPTSTLSAIQSTLVPPTATATEAPTSTPDLTATATEELTSTPDVPATPTQIPTTTPTTAPTITPTPFTAEAYEQTYATAVAGWRDSLDVSEDDLYAVLRAQLYREKLFNLLAQDVPVVQEQAWVRQILAQDLATAETVIERLNAGEDFTKLAAEFSQDTGTATTGGDLGWFPRGQVTLEVEEAAFLLEIGQISEPILSETGYYVVQVLGREERSLTSGLYSQLANQAFSDWLAEKRTAANPEIPDTWTKYVPEEPTIPAELLAQ